MRHHETLEQLLFDATISALDAETSAIEWSYWQYRRRVFGDCSVGVTLQMCNRVTNHGDMGTFSRPASNVAIILPPCDHSRQPPVTRIPSLI